MRPGLLARVAPLAPVAVACALTFPFLGSRSFWLDESLSYTLARVGWPEFTETVAERENNMVLYHFILRAWTAIGTSEAFVRALSVLFALVALVAFYGLVRRLFGLRVALGASLLLAANPIFVHYAREARGYALCLALVTLASYCFAHGLARPTWAIWIAYAAASALAVYAHLFAVFVPPAHAVSLLFLMSRRPPWAKLTVSASLLAAGLVPFLALATSAQASGIEWAASNAIGRIFVRLREAVPVSFAAAAVLVAAALAFYWAWRFRATRLAASPRTWPWAFALSWLAVPVALITLLSFFATPAFVIRYFIIVVPPLLLLPTLVLARRTGTETFAVVLLVAVTSSAAATLSWSPTAEERWELATEEVADEARPGDGVLFFPAFVRVPFQLYLAQGSRAEAVLQPVYPRPPWGEDLLALITDVPLSAETVRNASAPYRRIWLVLSHVEYADQADYRGVLAGLASAFRSTERTRLEGVTVIEYQRRDRLIHKPANAAYNGRPREVGSPSLRRQSTATEPVPSRAT